MSSTIAAIVPVYNRSTVVVEALQSVRDQTRPPRTLIVVDDGSTDGTGEAVQGWIDRVDLPFETRLIRQENQGVSAARNRGVSEAGEIDLLAFLDSDDLWPDDYLQRMADALAARPDAVAASCDRMNCDGHTGRSEHRSIAWIQRQTTRRIFVHGPPGTPNSVFRYDAFKPVGGYETAQKCAEDYQLMLRVSLLGPWLYVPDEPVIVRRNLGSGSASQLSKGFNDRRYRLAQILDRFIHEDAGREALPERVWRRRLGRMWYAAGRQLACLGRDQQARECFERAVEILPWHLRARWRKLLGFVRSTMVLDRIEDGA